MTNKLLALLVLIIVSLLGYFFYVYFFIYYDGVVSVSSNVSQYQVKLYAPKIGKTFLYECPQEECRIEEIAPLDYNLTISKEGYENYFTSFKLWKSEQKELSVNLKKKLSLIPIKKEELEVSKEDKIEILRLKSTAYAFFDFKELGIFLFKKSWNSLLLEYISPAWREESDLLSFSLVPKEALRYEKVYGTEDVFLIILGNEKYLYNFSKRVLKKIELSLDIIYAKVGIDDEYSFSTEVGTYVFDFRNSSLEYFPLFFDFVPLSEERLIGLVKWDDEVRLKNFWLDWSQGDVVFDFLRDTLEKNILLETSSSIKKIYREGESVYAETVDGEVFRFDGL